MHTAYRTQDTGTAIVMGKRGQYVWTDGRDEEALSRGIFKAYTQTNLRCACVRAHQDWGRLEHACLCACVCVHAFM